ncbi:MAG: permease [Pseudomonadota bacterium]
MTALIRRASHTLALPNLREPVWWVIAAILAALALLDPFQFIESARSTGWSLVEVLPFLALAVGVAGYAKASGSDQLIANAFIGRPLPMIFAAALIGAVAPFCSCGVIPLIAALLSMGVPLAPVMAFWLASPIMDPSMFALTVGTLGIDFAIAKTAAAFAIGAFGGLGVLLLQRAGRFENPLREGVGDGGCGGATIRAPQPIEWCIWREDSRMSTFGKEARRSSLFLLKWLTLAFVLESLMLAYIPESWIISALGSDNAWSLPLATIIGVPAYLNGFAALPLVSGLLEQGMAPGAALAFMVAGGVTCIPAAIAVFALVRKPAFLAYLGFALVGAFLCGLAFRVIMA